MLKVCELRNIFKDYLFKSVLKDMSLSLTPGQFYGLLGENGAGKSTIFKIIVGLERATKGSGDLLSESFTKISAPKKEQIGIVSELIELDSPFIMKKFFQFYSSLFPRWNHDLFTKIIHHQGLDLNKHFNKYSLVIK